MGKQGREARKESDDATGGERRYDGRADAIDSYKGRVRVSRSKEGIYNTSRALMQ